MNMINIAGDTKLSSSSKTFSFLLFNISTIKRFQTSNFLYVNIHFTIDQILKKSSSKLLQRSQINPIILINSQQQKINLNIEHLSINIHPPLIRIFPTLSSQI
jgi:hypothetical protein